MAVAVDRSARRGVFIFHNMPEERKSHGSLRFKYMYTANDEAGSSWIADRKKKTKLRIRGFFIAVVFFFRLSGPTFRKVISEMTQKGFSTSVKTEEFSALLLNIFKGFANISIPFLNFFWEIATLFITKEISLAIFLTILLTWTASSRCVVSTFPVAVSLYFFLLRYFCLSIS